MRCWAARYWQDSKRWDVGVWISGLHPDKYPHDWDLLISPRKWRTIARCPKGGEVMRLRLHIVEVG